MDKSKNKTKLVLLHFAGYGYFFMLIFGILGLFGITLYLILNFNRLGFRILDKLLPIALVLIGLIRGFFAALSAKIPAPEGIEISKEEFPEFYKMLEEIRVKINCPRIHHVKFDLSFNASAAEIPMYGLFGVFRRYLVIGIPLMLALSKDELRAVIGHELGHLSKSHSKMSVKALRAENVWRKTYEELIKSGKDKNLFFKSFLIRYIPALNNALLSLRRENEYIADKAAEIVTDSATVAKTLVKIPLYDSYMDGVFWNRINALARVEEAPPKNLFQVMEKFFDEPLPEELSKQILDQILKVQSLPCWTHPSTSERLENIGANYELPKHRRVSALRDILGDKADIVLSKANDIWVSDVNETWSKIYNSCEESRQKLKQLEEKKSQDRVLTDEEEIDRALLLEDMESVEFGLEAFKKLYDLKPDDLSIAYHLGRLMIKSGDPEGQDILHKVMENDAQLIPYCCNLLYHFHRNEGRINQAQEYYYYAISFMATNGDVKNERGSVRFSNTYVPHDLDINTIEDMRRKLLEKGYVKRAYIAIKEVEYSGQFPLYVILVKFKGTSRATSKIRVQELVDSQLIPWEYFVVPIYGKNRELEYKFISLPNSRIV